MSCSLSMCLGETAIVRSAECVRASHMAEVVETHKMKLETENLFKVSDID